MRFKKAKKQGGVEASVELTCPPRSTSASCIKLFLEEKGFIRIKTPTDGNCFYHTLTKFLKLSQDPSLPDSYHITLRNIVVDKMLEDIVELAPFFVKEDNNNNNNNNNNFNINSKNKDNVNAIEQIQNLRKNGLWDSYAGDIVTQYAAKALNMKIKIYDVKAAQKAKKITTSKFENTGEELFRNIPAQPMKIISYTFEPEINTGVTVNMLRISDGHYELLYPEEAGVVLPLRRITKTVKKNNTSNLSKTKNIKSNSKYYTRSKKITNTLNKNILNKNVNNELAKQLAQLAMAEEAESLLK